MWEQLSLSQQASFISLVGSACDLNYSSVTDWKDLFLHMNVKRFLLSRFPLAGMTREAWLVMAGHHVVTMSGTSQLEDKATKGDVKSEKSPRWGGLGVWD